MLEAGLVGHARLRYLGTSAQKARLVVDLIRGKGVEQALATLRYTNKSVARDLVKVLDSALANARVKKPEVDVDRLFVKTAFVDGGPSLKRIRPAPMGRAFRVQKRMCHVTLGLGETALARPPQPRRAPASEADAEQSAAPGGEKKAAAGRTKAPARSGGRRTAKAAKPAGKTTKRHKAPK